MTIEVGTEIPPFEAHVEPEPMKVFTLMTDDSNPIHWNADSVIEAGLGDRVINQGGLNLGYVLSAVTAWTGSRLSVIGTRVRFLGNAFAGDTVVAGGCVAQIDASSTPALATVNVWLRHEDGTDLLSGTVTVRLPDNEK
ncbi:MaoC/PaaZ C-terminal domain-containing protein [Rhodococcus ruber]|uniref:MaoC/PaaZ C-terminal domain-containing protein n=1 Tax=Rhodococcus ruber TaxID=1830 RepID=A0ABT4MF49_9NOCA|nr:MaoC/PaaZ C-terminal domain-containing protein [Rhodococcus ruber]MCZ4519453.1 MaoC/PaaZ C-terminal domain-containing protein [Rhodococcus ruber]